MVSWVARVGGAPRANSEFWLLYREVIKYRPIETGI
jgi:hypothetical protein